MLDRGFPGGRRSSSGRRHKWERLFIRVKPRPAALPGAPVVHVALTKYAVQIQNYWVNFAKTGDPNGAGLEKWPKFDPQRRAYLEFTDAGPAAKEGLRKPYCDLFMEKK